MKRTKLGVEIPVQRDHRRNTINKLARTEVRGQDNPPSPSYGPGFRRMKARLGASKMEDMRQDTIAQQFKKREEVSGESVPERDRSSYKDYPTPRQRAVRRMAEEAIGKVLGTVEPHTDKKSKRRK